MNKELARRKRAANDVSCAGKSKKFHSFEFTYCILGWSYSIITAQWSKKVQNGGLYHGS